MTRTSDAKRIDELRSLLNQADHDYYVLASPSMADSEYDGLMRELSDLEATHPDLVTPHSPTQRIGDTVTEGFSTAEHTVPMRSIDNTYSTEDLIAWHDRISKMLGGGGESVELERASDEGGLFASGAEAAASELSYFCDPKIDGVAISLRYEHGQLVRATTRGDGDRGDDVTVQVRAIRAIPLQLRDTGPMPELLEVRGEIYMPNAEFERINREREEAGEPLFANARNSTAGTLKSLDPGVVAQRRLSFYAHGRGAWEGGRACATFQDFRAWLKELGVPIDDSAIPCATIDDVVHVIEEFETRRSSLGYGVDGMVVRVDQFDLQDALGMTSRAPRWCIAYKYPAEQGTTRLLHVEWQLGKGGTLTPRATMEPIELAGTTVQHATLHNIDEIQRKDIRVGDLVVVEKAGDIIPQVVRVVLEKRPKDSVPMEAPTVCPVTGGPVEKVGPKLYSVGPPSREQFAEQLKWFVARKQMDIDGMGDKLVDQLVSTEVVSTFADVFRLTRDALLALDRMGEKSADKLLASIEEAKSRGMERVLAGIGIRHIGNSGARTLAQHFPDIDALMQASLEEIEALPDFGTITAEVLHQYLRSDVGKEVIGQLQAAGVDLTSRRFGQDVAAGDAPFAERTFVITGTLERWKRDDLASELAALGGKVTGSVTSKTSVLIAGEKAGSKLAKAEKLGIEIWDEERVVRELDSAATG